ncbi:MAG: ABC transporter substrate-binding protein, partial [Raoultibacter sp.]
MNMKTLERDAKFYLAGLFVIALCLGACFLSGCTEAPKAQAGSDAESAVAEGSQVVRFTDDLGNEVTVDNPQRVVACMGSFANTWELAGGTLVGATDDAFTSYEIASAEVAQVGDFTAPNLEAIIALEPDFVIMTGASSGKDGVASQTDLKQTLEASGIKVAYFNVTTFDDYLRMLRTFCDITGRDDLYEQHGTAVQQQIESIKTAAASQSEQPRVLLMTTFSGGTRVQNSATMTGTMLADLGVVNLADENKSLLKDFSLE